MEILDFIFKKMTEKFVNDTEDELRKYERYLEKEIKKGGSRAKEKEAIKAVRKALGYSTDMVVETVETKRPKDDWKTRQKKKKELFKKQVSQAIEENFDTDLY